MAIKYHSNIRLMDNNVLQIGTGGDLKLEHTGSHSNVYNTTGNLNFINYADDQDVTFQCDDHTGGVTEYFRLDGGLSNIQVSKRMVFSDSAEIYLGSSSDLVMWHNGTHAFFYNGTGDWYIRNSADDGDILFQGDDGAGGIATYFTIDGSLATHNGSFTTATYTLWGDRSHIAIGGAKDMQLYHDGSNSYIQQIDGATGDLIIEQGVDDGDMIFKSDDGSGGTVEYFRLDGGLSATYITRRFIFSDSTQLQFGNQSDTQIYNDGSNFYIDNITGDQDIIFKGTDGSSDITALTLDMSDAGTAIFNHDIKLADNNKAFFGGGTDLSIYHDGSNSYILHNGDTGNLVIQNSLDDTDIIFKCDNGSGGTTAYITLDGGLGYSRVHKTLRFDDSTSLALGVNNDFLAQHDGTDTLLYNDTGDLYITNRADDKDIIFQSDDGSGGVTAYITLDGSAETVVFGKAPEIPEYINHTGDGNTNFGFGGADDFRVTVGGTKRFNVAAGIEMTGTTSIIGSLTVGADGAGHDVKFFLNASGRYIMVDEDDNSLIFTDNASAKWGNGGDLQLMHDGTDSRIDNMVGHLKIRNYSDDSDIIFESDNGSGSTTEYLRIDGGVTKTIFSQDTIHSDSVEAMFGTGEDLKIKHDGSNSYIRNFTGDLYILNAANDKDVIFQSDDGSGGVTTYLFLDGSLGYMQAPKSIRFADSAKAWFGDSNDLEIQHTGSATFISNYVGDFYIDQNTDDGDIIFRCDDGSGGVEEYFRLDGSAGGSDPVTRWPDSSRIQLGTSGDADLYHDGTDTYFYNSTGDLKIINYADDKDIIFQSDDGSGGVETYFYLDGSTGRTRFNDSKYLIFGTDQNLFIVHDGTDSFIQNYTSGDFYIDQRVDDKDIVFRADDGAGGTGEYFRLDGSATSHDGSATTASYTTWKDKSRIALGTSRDMQLYHDGTSSYIQNQTGNLTFKNFDDDTDIIFQNDDGSGGTTEYFRLDGGDGATRFSRQLIMQDNVNFAAGSGVDLRIYHDATDSYIHNDTGDLNIECDTDDGSINLRADNGSGGLTTYLKIWGQYEVTEAFKNLKVSDNVKFVAGGGVDLQIYHDGTNSYIHNNTGTLRIEADQDDGDIEFRADDNSGGLETYMYLDGGNNNIKFQKDTNWIDSEKAIFGTGSDLQIYHDATDSRIENSTGDLQIQNFADDKDIKFLCDDGSGGTETYFMLDGSNNFMRSLKHIRFDDNASVLVGSSSDLSITHNGTNSVIANSTGDLQINQNTDDGDLIFQCDDGSGGTTEYFKLDGGAAAMVASKSIYMADSKKFYAGGGGDLGIYHNGTNSYIDNATGDLYIRNLADDEAIIFQCDDGSGGVETYFQLEGISGGASPFTVFPDDSVVAFGSSHDLRIYHSGTSTFMTNYVGNFYIDQNLDDGDIVFRCDDGSGGVTAYLTLDGSAGYTTVQKNIRFEDSVRAEFGNSGDLDIYHTGSYSVIDNATGHLYIENGADDSDIYLRSDDGSGGKTAYITLDGGVGYTLADKHIRFADDIEARFGAGSDLRIYHDGNNNFVDGYNGHVYIRNTVDDHDIVFQTDDGSGGITAYMTLDGSAANTIVHTDFLIPAQKKLRDSSNQNKYIELSDSSANVVYSAYAKHVWRTYDGSAYGDRMSITNTGELEAPRRKFAKTGTSDGDHDGDVVYFGGTTSMVAGKLYHYKSDGTWELADASAVATCDGLLGVSLGTASDTDGVLLRGMVTIANDPGAVGDVLFVSESAGQCIATAPSTSNAIVRVVGYCLDASNGQIWFNPDGTFVEVA